MHVQSESENESSLFACFVEEGEGKEKERDCWTLVAVEPQVDEYSLLFLRC